MRNLLAAVLSLICILCLTTCKSRNNGSSEAATADSSDAGFKKYVEGYIYPNFYVDNPAALNSRIKLLMHAPKGSTVKILTFVWENGKSTNFLAAHMCKAAKRGVNIQFMADSKYGSYVDKENHWFNEPANEEVYQRLANCGVKVKIYNRIPTKYDDIAFRSKIFDKTLKAVVAKLARDEYETFKDSPINRLNHRKLFLVEQGQGRSINGCAFVGGRNLGDHYLDWENEGNNFLDSDLLVCHHHVSKTKQAIFETMHASFDELWNAALESAGGEKRPLTHDITPNQDYRFKHLWFSRAEDNDLLDIRTNPYILNGTKGDEEHSEIERNFPLAVDLEDPDQPIVAFELKNITDFRFVRTYWRRDHKDDEVRKELIEGVKREQAELFIESAYLTLDSELGAAVEAAWKRGVDVTLVSNSAFVMDGAGARFISIYNNQKVEEWKTFIRDNPNPKFGKLRAFYLTYIAGHMLHFKGASFRCQKKPSGGYEKKFILGSHNFHPRSGLSDKEHAIVWLEKVGKVCLDKVGKDSVPASDIANDDPAFADETDAVGRRLVWYKETIKDFDDVSRPILVEHDQFQARWNELNASVEKHGVGKFREWLRRKVKNKLYKTDGRHMEEGAMGLLKLLQEDIQAFL